MDNAYNFDNLAYIVFNSKIDQGIPGLYSKIYEIIDKKQFNRPEDQNTLEDDPLNKLTDEAIKFILSKVWTLTESPTISIYDKNLIAFYIYFNRKLQFATLLIQGQTIKDFTNAISIKWVIDRITNAGIYPVKTDNLFERLYDSIAYSVLENGNIAESKMSLREYISNPSTKDILTEVYNGFGEPIDGLTILYDIDLSKRGSIKLFSSEYLAFKEFKTICLIYTEVNELSEYMKKLVPFVNSVYLNRSIISNSTDRYVPNKELWDTLEQFDSIFKINKKHINKKNISVLFDRFSSSGTFPLVSKIENNEFLSIWEAWYEFLKTNASNISSMIINTDDYLTHNYDIMYRDLISLVNSKFIINYLNNNSSFVATKDENANLYTEVDEAIQDVYNELRLFKLELKRFIKYVISKDRRFRISNNK